MPKSALVLEYKKYGKGKSWTKAVIDERHYADTVTVISTLLGCEVEVRSVGPKKPLKEFVPGGIIMSDAA